ncbi:TonB-dependent receptor [Flavobacterium sp. SUN046]|uniref:TonB-dependent receptor n=1 Tax=Flavobacterium sp. SUN046 TaxID=3002440 RepID=UPI002DBD2F8D|nr:TonB-dependent receptor [Flavobacterium sp. SUN046]MEC4050044.1 TonB-dependent receptor [Flavobacterium sp. SUN046]
MKNATTKFCLLVLLLMTTMVFSQGKIKGSIIDNELHSPLSGVNITVKGLPKGTITDMDGKFTLNATTASGQVVISYIGYKTQNLNFSFSKGTEVDLGTLTLVSDSNQLEEVVIKSTVIDIAKDRKTPVAVSTIKASEIQQKLGNQEFPEILANTPSVYASKAGGGFGDSRVVIRGFDQKNIAVMINGVPVNDMENSSVYWSNWAGLSDVTSYLQVQRGLGSSKIVNAAVGGNINVVTKTSDMKEGGTVSTSVANNNYLKTNVAYNTGKMKNGVSASVLLSQTSGSEYANGTEFQGGNYYIAFGYEANKKNNLQFTFTGAPQWHNQRTTSPTIAQYLKFGENGEPNRRLNLDAGYLNGDAYNFKTNYYHKPVASLNWDYKISEKTKFSTVLYGSWGRGGGTSANGVARGLQYTNDLFRNTDGTLNVDKIQAWNTGQLPITVGTNTATRSLTNGEYLNYSSTSADLTNGISKIASTNSHNWYGAVASLNTKLSNAFTLDFGFDMRAYKGIHFQTVTDNIGATGYKDLLTSTNGNSNAAQPNNVYTTYAALPNLNPLWNTDYQTKVNYNNDSKVNWLGGFTQLEYSKNNLTAFVQGAVSQQAYKRIDYFRYTVASGDQETSFKKLLGGNIKAGLNYNINKHHSVFVNSGYYSKQPFMNAVYPNNRNIVNSNLTNEKILGFELGYGFRSSKFNANVNVYRTTWKDRFQTVTDNTILTGTTLENPNGYFSFSGINETHQGVEIDMNYKPFSQLMINAMFSMGDYHYDGNASSTRYTVTNEAFGNDAVAKTLYLDRVKVGNAPQTTTSIGATYEVVKRVKLDANYRFTDRLYANMVPTNFQTDTNQGVLQLPSFGLVDAGFSYKMLVGRDKNNSVNFRLNVNNLLDKIYILESNSNNFVKTRDNFTTDAAYAAYTNTLYKGLDPSNQVFFGFGRTWNFTMTYNF